MNFLIGVVVGYIFADEIGKTIDVIGLKPKETT